MTQILILFLGIHLFVMVPMDLTDHAFYDVLNNIYLKLDENVVGYYFIDGIINIFIIIETWIHNIILPFFHEVNLSIVNSELEILLPYPDFREVFLIFKQMLPDPKDPKFWVLVLCVLGLLRILIKYKN